MSMQFLKELETEDRELIENLVDSINGGNKHYSINGMRKMKEDVANISGKYVKYAGRIVQIWIDYWKLLEKFYGKGTMITLWNIERTTQVNYEKNTGTL